MLHRIAHWLHWWYGEIVTEWSGDTLWVGFRCVTCGKISDAHRSYTQRKMVPEWAAAHQGLMPPAAWAGGQIQNLDLQPAAPDLQPANNSAAK